jgi:protein-cysteine N-palmitoyltransferase HHAT
LQVDAAKENDIRMNLKDLYKVETLDTRFGSKTTPEGSPLPDAQPSKWRTAEYYVYYLFFLTIPVLMVKSVYDVSGPQHPGWKRYENLLESGWIPGRKVDNSDAQYRGFRDNVPYMALVVTIHPLCRKLYERLTASRSESLSNVSNGSISRGDGRSAEQRLKVRVNFDFAFALLFLLALHGISIVKVLAILWFNYQVATKLPRQYVSVATWIFNIAILFANELGRGYPLASISSLLLPSQTTNVGSKGEVTWGAWLDSYGGLVPRWEILFNITVLRLIAFNFDYLWMLDRRAASPVEVRPTHLPIKPPDTTH